ncbi:MAG: head GIN domain-containing protein [Anaerolineaceae bacterium]
MKNKMIIIMLILAMLGLTLACNLPSTVSVDNTPIVIVERGSGKLTSEERTISSFKILSIAGGGWIKLVQGDEYKLVIEAEDNILPHIKSEIDGDRLKIGYDENSWKDRYVPTKKITYTLTIPTLEKIILLGGAEIESDSLEVEKLDLDLNGGANVILNGFKAETLNVQLDGGVNFSINGEVATQTIKVNGAANYTAGNLKSGTTDLVINGAGNATIWAVDALNIRLIGVGTVNYYGSPQVSKDIQGLGTVTSLGEK